MRNYYYSGFIIFFFSLHFNGSAGQSFGAFLEELTDDEGPKPPKDDTDR